MFFVHAPSNVLWSSLFANVSLFWLVLDLWKLALACHFSSSFRWLFQALFKATHLSVVSGCTLFRLLDGGIRALLLCVVNVLVGLRQRVDRVFHLHCRLCISHWWGIIYTNTTRILGGLTSGTTLWPTTASSALIFDALWAWSLWWNHLFLLIACVFYPYECVLKSDEISLRRIPNFRFLVLENHSH